MSADQKLAEAAYAAIGKKARAAAERLTYEITEALNFWGEGDMMPEMYKGFIEGANDNLFIEARLATKDGDYIDLDEEGEGRLCVKAWLGDDVNCPDIGTPQFLDDMLWELSEHHAPNVERLCDLLDGVKHTLRSRLC